MDIVGKLGHCWYREDFLKTISLQIYIFGKLSFTFNTLHLETLSWFANMCDICVSKLQSCIEWFMHCTF